MWTEIVSEKDLLDFMNEVAFFHDSCVNKIEYVSGAYVDKDLSMHPLNDRRQLRILIQRQYAEKSAIELEFQELKAFRLNPVDCEYTCEILEAEMFFKDGLIYWTDCDFSALNENENAEGTFVCAKRLRYRFVELSGTIANE